jgi:hypothetical protein
MSKRTWYLTGVAGAVVFIVAQLVTGSLPKPGDEIGDVIQYVLVHRVRVLGGAAVASLAAPLLLIFASRLTKAMDDAEDGDSPLATPTLLAWVLLFGVIIAGQLPLLAVSWWGSSGADGLGTGSDVVRLAFDINNLALYAVSAPFAALSILGPCVVAWQTGFLPRWLIGIGAAEVVLNIVEVAGIGSSAGSNAAGYAFGLGPIVWMLWVICASVVLYRKEAPT